MAKASTLTFNLSSIFCRITDRDVLSHRTQKQNTTEPDASHWTIETLFSAKCYRIPLFLLFMGISYRHSWCIWLFEFLFYFTTQYVFTWRRIRQSPQSTHRFNSLWAFEWEDSAGVNIKGVWHEFGVLFVHFCSWRNQKPLFHFGAKKQNCDTA